MENKFAALTAFIPSAEKMMDKNASGDCAVWGRGQVGEHIVDRFVDTFYAWMSDNLGMRLDYYRDILAENGLSTDTLDKADIRKCDARCILAMIFASIRAERFSEGFLMSLFTDGTMLQWLLRLRALDH